MKYIKLDNPIEKYYIKSNPLLEEIRPRKMIVTSKQIIGEGDNYSYIGQDILSKDRVVIPCNRAFDNVRDGVELARKEVVDQINSMRMQVENYKKTIRNFETEIYKCEKHMETL